MSRKSTDSRTAELVIARPGIVDKGEKHWSVGPNLGVGYLAGAVRARGINVKVVDGKNEGHNRLEETVEVIRSYEPKFVGFSAMTTEYPTAIEIASRLKESGKPPITILGGVHASALPIDSLTESSAFDYVLTGEAEDSLPNFIEAIKSRKGINRIPGLYRRDKDGKPFSSCPTREVPDVNSLPFPAWDLLPRFGSYPVVMSRGCPYDCVFCGKNLGKKVRIRSVDHIMAEIEWLYKDYSPEVITFADETFGMKPKHTEELLGRLIEFNKDKGVEFTAQTRVNYISQKIVDMMKKANFSYLSFGVESGDPEVLARSGKKLRVEEVERALKIVKAAGIPHRCFFIIGLPGETKASVRKTIDLAVKLNPNRLSVALIVPYPGTKIYEWALKGSNGYRMLSNSWNQFDKYLGASLEMESLSYFEMRRLQVQLYLEAYIRNFRFKDLAKFIYGNRTLALSYGQNLLKKGMNEIPFLKNG